MKPKFTMILMLLALVVQLLNAQQKTVSGTVSDENGLPLPGATVIRAGTSSGTSTDFDGNYQIKASTGDVLEISYVGYATQSITIGASNTNTYNANMVLDNTLDEVIVTGVARGTSTKKLGFSVGKENKDDLQEVPAADPANALRGKVSGVRIVQASGNPASSPEIRLRGSTSISGNQRRLLIVDGIITDGDLKDIAVEDIESMEVIKGAAAATLDASPRNTEGNITTTATDVEIKKALLYEYAIELHLNGSFGNNYFFMRRNDLLQKGTPTHFPVPADELGITGDATYTFGGESNAGQDGTAIGGTSSWKNL